MGDHKGTSLSSGPFVFSIFQNQFDHITPSLKCHSFSTAPQQMRWPRKELQKWGTNQDLRPSVQNCHLIVGVLWARFTHTPEREVCLHHTSRSRRQERSQLPASQMGRLFSYPLLCSPRRNDTPSDCLPRVYTLANLGVDEGSSW